MNPASIDLCAESTNLDLISLISSIVNSIGSWDSSSKGIELGPLGIHPPSLLSILPLPCHGLLVEAFLPAWANCIAGV